MHNTASSTALPAIAIASNGTVGLLFTRHAGGNLETHFTQSATDFATVSTSILSRFRSGNPAPVFDPYIGDYQDLQAVGTQFFGTFSASNNVGNFPLVRHRHPPARPEPAAQRQHPPHSIDPFFFSLTAVNPP